MPVNASRVELNRASNWTREEGYLSVWFPLRSQPGQHETVRTCDCKALMQDIRIQLRSLVWVLGVPTLATFSSFILRVQPDVAIVPRGPEVVQLPQEQHRSDLPGPRSCTNIHPLMSARPYCLLFPHQVQRRADLRRDQTCSRHSSLTCQEVEGRTCIWLQR